MKKALLLGAMAFLAINIVAVQNVNAQVRVEKKSADELKMEKEKAEQEAAKTATTQTGFTSAQKASKKEINTRDAKATTATMPQEKKDAPVSTIRKRPTLVQPTNANGTAKGKIRTAGTVDPTAKNTSTVSTAETAPKTAASSLKPRRPVDPTKQSAESKKNATEAIK